MKAANMWYRLNTSHRRATKLSSKLLVAAKLHLCGQIAVAARLPACRLLAFSQSNYGSRNEQLCCRSMDSVWRTYKRSRYLIREIKVDI